jgi:hypothetical protein
MVPPGSRVSPASDASFGPVPREAGHSDGVWWGCGHSDRRAPGDRHRRLDAGGAGLDGGTNTDAGRQAAGAAAIAGLSARALGWDPPTPAPGLGSIEGAVYHHVAHRLKRHEAWWSATGTDHLVRLLAARANGTLDTALARVRPEAQPAPAAPAPTTSWLRREPGDIAVSWLQAHVPALTGPHADRPWIRYVLRELLRTAS